MANAKPITRYQLCVSGAAHGKSVKEGRSLAVGAGRAIAEQGHMLLTGATVGLPNYAAAGAKVAGGVSVGFSPAATKLGHVKKYRLPTGCYDTILYTGLHYVGRDTLLIASSDAVVSVGGRLGTLHEFTIAMEMNKPIGFLQGAGGISTEIKDILKAAGIKDDADVVFDTNPDSLVKKLTSLLDERYKDIIDIYSVDQPCVACAGGVDSCEVYDHSATSAS